MFSIRLKELRQKHDLSQREFANIINVSTGTVGNWEVGLREPDFKTLVKIADFFDVSCDYLLDRYAEKEETPPIRISVSSIEEEMLSAFRKAGKTLGVEGQQAIISIVEILTNRSH